MPLDYEIQSQQPPLPSPNTGDKNKRGYLRKAFSKMCKIRTSSTAMRLILKLLSQCTRDGKNTKKIQIEEEYV